MIRSSALSRRLIALGVLLCAFLVTAPDLRSHPHVLVESSSQIVFDDNGAITEIRHRWIFDLPFSVYAVEGLDEDGDGTYSRAELDPLAKVNVESLAEFAFFTFLYAGSEEPPYGEPRDYWLTRAENGQLTLNYTLPMAAPFDPRNKLVEIDVYDPEYFVAFGFAQSDPAVLVDAPDDCTLEVRRPEPLDEVAAAQLAELPPEIRELPPEYTGLVSGIANKLIITCGEVALVQVADGGRELTPAAAPFGVAPVDPAITPGDGPFSGFLRWVSAQQSRLYRLMTDAVAQVRDSPAAGLTVLAFSFLYGVLHAAGPGHGKAVMSSYVLANRETARRGAAIAFIAAIVQALVAIAIVTVMTLILSMTSASMTRTANWLEIASFVLIALVGASLVWRAWRLRPRTALPGPYPHEPGDGHDHHAHGACCGHDHAPDPKTLGGALSFTKAWNAVLAIGIRPCSGALILLVFCFAQGLFLLGIVGTLAMAVGTGMVTAAIATSALGARALVERMTRSPAATATLSFAIELGAGAFVLLFGMVFLAGALARQGLM